MHHYKLGGGFKYFLFSPLFGEDFQFDEMKKWCKKDSGAEKILGEIWVICES